MEPVAAFEVDTEAAAHGGMTKGDGEERLADADGAHDQAFSPDSMKRHDTDLMQHGACHCSACVALDSNEVTADRQGSRRGPSIQQESPVENLRARNAVSTLRAQTTPRTSSCERR